MSEATHFKTIYDNHSKMVFNLCLNYLQNTEEAEEATQDVFIKLHSKLNQFKGNSSLKTWIYQITIRHCLDVIKARNRKKRFGFMQSLFNKSGEDMGIHHHFNHPGVELESKETVQQLMEFINALADNQKTAIILKSIDGLSGKEIAKIMDMSEKAVESLLSRAKQNLKNKINDAKE